MNKTIYDFPDIYERIGMQLGHFGCIMLDVEPVNVSAILGEDKDWFYSSTNPMLRYVKGPVGQVEAHATLLYGLTPGDNAGVNQKASVDELLSGLDLSSVTIDDVEAFAPQFNEPYGCVVARLNTQDNDLSEANRRLRFLPHIDSFLEYKPHVTLAYIKEDLVEEAIEKFADELIDTQLSAIKINYGGPIA